MYIYIYVYIYILYKLYIHLWYLFGICDSAFHRHSHWFGLFNPILQLHFRRGQAPTWAAPRISEAFHGFTSRFTREFWLLSTCGLVCGCFFGWYSTKIVLREISKICHDFVWFRLWTCLWPYFPTHEICMTPVPLGVLEGRQVQVFLKKRWMSWNWYRCPFPIDWLINRGVLCPQLQQVNDDRWHTKPAPLFYQKDMIGNWEMLITFRSPCFLGTQTPTSIDKTWWIPVFYCIYQSIWGVP